MRPRRHDKENSRRNAVGNTTTSLRGSGFLRQKVCEHELLRAMAAPDYIRAWGEFLKNLLDSLSHLILISCFCFALIRRATLGEALMCLVLAPILRRLGLR